MHTNTYRHDNSWVYLTGFKFKIKYTIYRIQDKFINCVLFHLSKQFIRIRIMSQLNSTLSLDEYFETYLFVEHIQK